MRDDLLAALRKAADDRECRVVIITGAGRAFCAGGDVEFMRDLQARRCGRVSQTAARRGGHRRAIGMVDRVTSDLASETQKLARSLADAPLALLGDIKRALNASNDLRRQLDLESEHQLRAFQSAESAERINAFLEKRSR